jgi:hypothetical protein
MWCGIRAERAAGPGVREPPLAPAPTVEAVLDRLAARHGEHLVVIEGAAGGRIMRRTCGVSVMVCRRTATGVTRSTGALSGGPALATGPERNSRMLLQDRPQLIVCFTTSSTPHPAGRRTWHCGP